MRIHFQNTLRELWLLDLFAQVEFSVHSEWIQLQIANCITLTSWPRVYIYRCMTGNIGKRSIKQSGFSRWKRSARKSIQNRQEKPSKRDSSVIVTTNPLAVLRRRWKHYFHPVTFSIVITLKSPKVTAPRVSLTLCHITPHKEFWWNLDYIPQSVFSKEQQNFCILNIFAQSS